MPRQRIKSIKVQGRVSEDKTCPEDVDFVKAELKKGVQEATFIRQAVSVYRQYKTGELFAEILHKYDLLTPEEKMATKQAISEKVVKSKTNQKEKTSITDSGNGEEIDGKKVKILDDIQDLLNGNLY